MSSSSVPSRNRRLNPDLIAGRLAHAVGAVAKSAWFGAHYLAARRQAGKLDEDGKPFRLAHKLPTLPQILMNVRELINRDRANVERGFYPAPEGPPLELAAARRASRRFLDDAQEVARRRRQGAAQEAAAMREDLPRYYRQNFHFQTDGYLSADSAALYDFQVETLFGGTAGAMRRQVLPLLAEGFAGRDQRKLRLLELGCGTGALTAEIARAFPRLAIEAIDPSADYLAAARKRLAGQSRVQFHEEFAERLGFADASFDAVTSCYLFHELPPKIRKAVAAEIARVTKPGGIYVHAETIQYGDTPRFDAFIEAFPRIFHEPYYESYAKVELASLFSGFEMGREATGFLTKASLFRRT